MSPLDYLWAVILFARTAFWAAVAVGFDFLQAMDPLWIAAVLLAWTVGLYGWGTRMQSQVIKHLRTNARPLSPWRFELRHSLPGLIAVPLIAGGRGMRAIGAGFTRMSGGLLGKLLARLGRSAPAQPAAAPTPTEDTTPPPVLVPTLGPSFFGGALITATIYLLGLVLGPLVGWVLDLSPGYPPWQYLMLGDRPELAPYLPLQAHAVFGALVVGGFWLTVWWNASRVVRAIHHRWVYHNGMAQTAPSWWPRGGGVDNGIEPSASYLRWAQWLPRLGIAGLVLAWSRIDGNPYQLDPSLFAVAGTLTLGWLLHLRLRGWADPPPEHAPAPLVPPPPGWPEVLQHLREHHRIDEPGQWREARPVAELRAAVNTPDIALVSPLLWELLPSKSQPTAMQARVLTTLSEHAHVLTAPPADASELSLTNSPTEVDLRRVLHTIVLSPEGTGKTTLALLAAVNHVLVHTQAVLWITRNAKECERRYGWIRRQLEPSTLRWNVRARQLGGDLVNDLAAGIMPDLLVCSLEEAVVELLESSDTYAQLLRQVGLVIVDDVDAWCGPIEIHSQLALRRLMQRVRATAGLAGLGNARTPQVLVLGVESMHNAAAWVRGVCGIEGEVLRFGVDAEPGEPRQRFYRLSDFVSEHGERASLTTLLEACEAAGVPWHFRPCGDDRRDHGRHLLSLAQEPQHGTAAAHQAVVVFLDGEWSAVQREIQRLVRAGAGRNTGTVAFITAVDSDLDMAFTQHATHTELAHLLATLPHPVPRIPTGASVVAHLSAELVSGWAEVGDLVDVFGGVTQSVLRDLARAGMLLTREQVDVPLAGRQHQHLLFVRALSKAIDAGSDRPLLPARVSQVEHASHESVRVLDRTNLTVLATVDGPSAAHRFYPGCVFENARGRFLVVDSGPDVVVEPYLGDEITSPRRRASVSFATDISGKPLLMGADPVEVAFGPMQVSVEHVATFRLGPQHCEQRQRLLWDGSSPPPLTTEGLLLVPNPAASNSKAPRLAFAEARLVAAAMRAVLPSLIRGASSDLTVELRLHESTPAAEYVLGPTEGIAIYDLHTGGNGAARALYNHGLESLLRLVRLVLERVLYHGRLLARYDTWGDPEEVLTRSPATGTATAFDPHRDIDAQRRHEALNWLDSRLRPEDGAALNPRLGVYGSGSEPGEGDVFDLGRCWVTPQGGVTNLVWCRHRWTTDGNREVALDLGVDRSFVYAAQRWQQPEVLAQITTVLETWRSDPAYRLDDDSVWGAPRSVWGLRDGQVVTTHAPVLEDAAVLSMQSGVLSALQGTGPVLRAWVATLADRLPGGQSTSERVQVLTRFVQSIPTRGGAPFSPMAVLLERQGEANGKAVLLAGLLEAMGVSAGLFFCAQQQRLVAGAGLAPTTTHDGAARNIVGAMSGQGMWAPTPQARDSGRWSLATPMVVERGDGGAIDPSQWVWLPLVELPALTDTHDVGASP